MESFEKLLTTWLTSEESSPLILWKKPNLSSQFTPALAAALDIERTTLKKDSQLSSAFADLLTSLMVRCFFHQRK